MQQGGDHARLARPSARTAGLGSAVRAEVSFLFDNVDDPIITLLSDTLHEWTDGETLHQIMAPGFEVREVPDGWSVREYGD